VSNDYGAWISQSFFGGRTRPQSRYIYVLTGDRRHVENGLHQKLVKQQRRDSSKILTFLSKRERSPNFLARSNCLMLSTNLLFQIN
jgi:hypothetical protein